MKRTTARRHLELGALEPIAAHADGAAIVRAHANPVRRGLRLVTARNERHEVRRELHEFERDAGAVTGDA